MGLAQLWAAQRNSTRLELRLARLSRLAGDQKLIFPRSQRCDTTTGRVTDINLRGESEDPIFKKAGRSGYVTGKLSPAICGIDTLTTLVVADWKDIAKEIPACITALPSHRILDLIGNKLSGEIPADVSKFSCLTVLNLTDNALSDKIPTSITWLGSLKHLNLNNNQLCGEILKDFGNLVMLSRMLLTRN
ncbi:DNA-damage-repair/toleration protein DRT100 [Glycine soja]|uniref:DNA-damage-repair/toleration protein DRT100 n=1 Tax=Glycine soja TaxID=3848 RepID=A0A0B2QXI5_GLYSO|nr:hypothetical protein JHK87_035111 [Glycine soja]KAG4975832.1 hypothetical protein JHK86_035306 [Glycine max]KHN24357.1 DNA-damage-repair/toleration protein DRT100 [Glycine soja]